MPIWTMVPIGNLPTGAGPHQGAMLANPFFLVAVIHPTGPLCGALVSQKEKRALRRDPLIHLSNTFSIWPTFFWTLPASFSFWPSAARLGLFVTCPAFSLALPFISRSLPFI